MPQPLVERVREDRLQVLGRCESRRTHRLGGELGHEIPHAKRSLVVKYFACCRQFTAGANCDQHRSVAALAGTAAHIMVYIHNLSRLIGTQRCYYCFIKQVRVGVIPGRSLRFESMTEITTGDKRHALTDSTNSFGETGAKAQVIFVSQKTVAECYEFSPPTVFIQKIERHGRSMVETLLSNGQHFV